MFISSLFIAIWICVPVPDDRSNLAGPPCISFFSADLIGENYRIFDVECDGDGLIYLAYPDRDKVIVFDGETWQTIEVDSPLCLATDSQGIVWVGRSDGIGFFAKNELNQISFVPFDPGFQPNDLLYFQFAFRTEQGVRLGNGRFIVEVDTTNDEREIKLLRSHADENFVGFDGESVIALDRQPAVPLKIVGEERIPMLEAAPKDVSIECVVELEDGTPVFVTDGFKNLRVLQNEKLEWFSKSYVDNSEFVDVEWVLPMPGNRLGLVDDNNFTCFSNTGDILFQIASSQGISGVITRFGMFRDGRLWIITSDGFAVSGGIGVNCWPILKGGRPATFDIKLTEDDIFISADQGLFQVPRSDLSEIGLTSQFKRLNHGSAKVECLDEYVVCASEGGLILLGDDGSDTKIADGFFTSMYCQKTGDGSYIFAKDQYSRLLVFEFEDTKANLINTIKLPADGWVAHSFDESSFLIKQWNGKTRIIEFPEGFAADPIFHETPDKLKRNNSFRVGTELLLIDEDEIQHAIYVDGKVRFEPSPYFQNLRNTDAITNADVLIDCESEGIAICDRNQNIQIYPWEGDKLSAAPDSKFHFGHPFSIRILRRDQKNDCFWTMTGPNLFCLNAQQISDAAVVGSVNIQMSTSRPNAIQNIDDKVQLSYDDGVSFQFALPHRFYLSEDEPQYQYWLEGNNRSWSEWSDSTSKEFTNLRGGNYQFHVRARDPHGNVFGDSSTKFSVAVPWYLHGLAKALYGVLFFGLILVVSRIRTSKLKSDNEQMERLVQKRTEEIQKKSQEVLEKTEQLNAARRKSEAERLASFDTLVAGIAHDFNNLLTVVSANNEMMISNGDERTRRFATNSLEAIESAVELCKELSAFSDTNPAILQPVNVSKIALNVGEIASSSLPVNIEFEVESTGPDCFSMADNAQLKRALLNLIINACEAARQHVRVKVYLDEVSTEELMHARYVGDIPEPGQFNVIEVADDGNGFDRAVITRIFDPFFSTKKLGRGLGLAIVLKIVGRHNGVVFVESDTEGTRFKVCLPATNSRPKPRISPHHSFKIKPLKILIVDDDEQVLQSLELLLNSQGHQVTVAESAQRGLELVLERKLFDLLIVDVSMPVKSGPEMAAELFTIHPDWPVLLISGFSEKLIDSSLMDRTNLAFLAKPFSKKQLNSAIQNLVFEPKKNNAGIRN